MNLLAYFVNSDETKPTFPICIEENKIKMLEQFFYGNEAIFESKELQKNSDHGNTNFRKAHQLMPNIESSISNKETWRNDSRLKMWFV